MHIFMDKFTHIFLKNYFMTVKLAIAKEKQF